MLHDPRSDKQYLDTVYEIRESETTTEYSQEDHQLIID